MRFKITAKRAFPLFMTIVVVVLAQATWWVIFMARLIDEKVDMAAQLGASPEFVEQLHQEEIRRQIMLGSEGVLFLIIILFGAWLIYRALIQTEALKLRQQNFLLTVTHELKTPIASIRIYLDTLSSDKIPTEKKSQVIPRMKHDTLRLERMVNNILEATRFDHRKFLLDKSEVNLSYLLQEAINYLESAAEQVPREVRCEIQPDILIEADPKSFRRAIDAVLENSLKYHSGDMINLDIKLKQVGHKAVITIADQGVGFNPKESDAIFDRFYRVGSEMTRETDGTGLGLYLCREIVRAHGGEVTAQSDGIGKGARFKIEVKGKVVDENNSAG